MAKSRGLSRKRLAHIAEDLLPCSHGRYFTQRQVAARNNISIWALSRLMNDKHPQNEEFREVQRAVIKSVSHKKRGT